MMTLNDLRIDTPVEVSEKQYNHVMNVFSGLIAGRKDSKTGSYFIKLWTIKYAPEILKVLNSFN